MAQSSKEFTQKLDELKTRFEMTERGSDISPEEKKKCMDALKETIDSLKKVQTNLDEGTVDGRLLKVVMMYDSGGQTMLRNLSREHVCNSLFQNRILVVPPEDIKVIHEDCYQINPNKQVVQWPECFVKFKTNEQACTVSGAEHVTLIIGRCHLNVRFVWPTGDVMREKLQTIGESIKRIQQIEKEFSELGASRQPPSGNVCPVLPENFIDKAVYTDALKEIKRKRAEGKDHDHHTVAMIFMKPTDAVSRNAKIKALFNEEMDLVLKLKEFQLEGIDFEFQIPGLPL
jgi:hypothetical protein